MQEVKMNRLSKQAIQHFNRKEKVYGQFWTPQEVADFIVSFASKQLKDRKGIACDPACGDGVFLRSLKNEGFKPCGLVILLFLLNMEE